MDSTSIYSGLGGLFGGFQNGLQMLLALQKADEDRKIRQGELGVNQGELKLKQQQYADTEADKPYADIQSQHNKSNIMASQADIRREETPPPIGDTYQPTNKFQPPAFGSNGLGNAPAPQHAPIGGLDSSHIAQVLQRANRTSNFQRNQDVLGGVLNAASQTAQTTQQPQAGRFTTPQGEQAELPTGYTAQPDKTFSPWQMNPNHGSGRMLWPQIQQEAERRYKDARTAYDRDHVMGMNVQGNPETAPDRNTFMRDVINEYVAGGKLSDSDAAAMGLNTGSDFGNVQGGSSTTAAPGRGAAQKTPAQWVAEVRAEHPQWTPEQLAAEARKRAGVR